MQKLNNFIKFVPKLPLILQLLLMPALVILLLLSVSTVIISFTVLFCRRHKLQEFMKHFVESKNEEMNRVIKKIETKYKAIKLQIEIDDMFNNGSNNNNLLQEQHDIEKAIKIVQDSKQKLCVANAEFDEAIQFLFSNNKQSKRHSKLPAWLAQKLPEEWCSDLEELQKQWTNSGCNSLIFKLKTTYRLLEMFWAKLMIKWQDFCDSHATKQIDNKRTTN